MSETEPTPDFSKWLGLQMIPAKNNPTFFRSENCEGILLTEVTTPEHPLRKGKNRKEFWSVTILVDGFEATGNDYDRAEARAEAFEKLKGLVGPLIQRFERLGLLPPN